METPDDPSRFSWSGSGDVSEKPEEIISVVVKDEDGKPQGLLEKWDTEEWIYAPVDDLEDAN